MIVNEERVADRILELAEFLENFPNSPMADPARNELNYLLSLI